MTPHPSTRHLLVHDRNGISRQHGTQRIVAPEFLFKMPNEMRQYPAHDTYWYTTETDFAYVEVCNGPDNTVLYERVTIIASEEDDSGRHVYVEQDRHAGWMPICLLYVPKEDIR